MFLRGMIKMNYKDDIVIWDRQSRKFVEHKEYNLDESSGREYFKPKYENLWLEDKVALDVFVIIDKGVLIPYSDFKRLGFVKK